jgi:hypothetical protein
MNKPKKEKILWLVKKNGNQMKIIGFLRDHDDSCFIIGGPTGSHYTGHGESWQSKWKEYMDDGYIDINSAVKNKILSSDWHSPKISKNDRVVVDMILQKKLKYK